MMAKPSGLQAAQYLYVRIIRGEVEAHDARATSRPEGEIVAEPTKPSTWMVPSASNVSLS